MKITINSKNLLKSVQKVGACINNSNTLPILDCVLLSTAKDQLFIKASNLEITAQTKVTATIEGSLHTCINYQMLSSILKNMPSGAVELSFTDKSVKIIQGASVYDLPLYDGKEFPGSENITYESSFTVDNKIFCTALGKAIKFTGEDEMRAFINTVNIHADGEKVNIVATDAHQLYKEQIMDTKDEYSLLVHKKALGYLSSKPLDSDFIELSYSKKGMRLSDDITWIEVTLVDAKYPNYNALIPSEDGTSIITGSRSEFLAKLNNISAIYMNTDWRRIVLELTNNETIITSTNDMTNHNGREVVPMQLKGEGLKIGFKADIFKEMIKSVDEEELQIHFIAPNRAAWIRTETIFSMALPQAIN